MCGSVVYMVHHCVCSLAITMCYAVCMCAGDAYLKVPELSAPPYAPHVPYITCHPNVYYRELYPTDGMIVMGSDGLFNLCSSSDLLGALMGTGGGAGAGRCRRVSGVCSHGQCGAGPGAGVGRPPEEGGVQEPDGWGSEWLHEAYLEEAGPEGVGGVELSQGQEPWMTLTCSPPSSAHPLGEVRLGAEGGGGRDLPLPPGESGTNTRHCTRHAPKPPTTAAPGPRSTLSQALVDMCYKHANALYNGRGGAGGTVPGARGSKGRGSGGGDLRSMAAGGVKRQFMDDVTVMTLRLLHPTQVQGQSQSQGCGVVE